MFPTFFLNSLSLSLSYTSIKSEIRNVCILSLPLSVSTFDSNSVCNRQFVSFLSFSIVFLSSSFVFFSFSISILLPNFCVYLLPTLIHFYSKIIFCKINVFYFYFIVPRLFSLPHTHTHTNTHTQTHSLSAKLSFFFLSLSLSHTHTHTHKLKYTNTIFLYFKLSLYLPLCLLFYSLSDSLSAYLFLCLSWCGI
jgi:hypothetical protein